MSKLLNKFLQNYSIDTLRDVEVSGLNDGDVLVYDSVDQKFKNQKQSRSGSDFAVELKDQFEQYSGNQFQTYSVLNFDVTGPDTLNTFRFNAYFNWGHNSASNDGLFRVLIDGVEQGGELRIEPKDAGSDQRVPSNILLYLSDLSVGTHSFALQYRPSGATRITRMYRSVLEVWRVQ